MFFKPSGLNRSVYGRVVDVVEESSVSRLEGGDGVGRFSAECLGDEDIHKVGTLSEKIRQEVLNVQSFVFVYKNFYALVYGILEKQVHYLPGAISKEEIFVEVVPEILAKIIDDGDDSACAKYGEMLKLMEMQTIFMWKIFDDAYEDAGLNLMMSGVGHRGSELGLG